MENSLPEKVDQFMTALMANQRRLYQYVHVLLPRSQDTEDVMQNTLMVLWKKFDQFDQSTSFYAWASRVAYLEALSYRRRNNRLVTILDEGLLEQISAEAEAKQELLEARREAMDRCADKLNLLDRQLLDMRYAPDGSVKDIARRLGRPANSVSKSLGRIRQALWDCINQELADAQEFVKGDES